MVRHRFVVVLCVVLLISFFSSGADAGSRTIMYDNPARGSTGIVLTTPNNYASCVNAVRTDVVKTTGVGNRQLKGQVILSYITNQGPQPVPNGIYLVNQTGDLNLTISYPPVSLWPVLSTGTREIHVDVQIELYQRGVKVATLGPGNDWDVFCLGNRPTNTPTRTPTNTPTRTPVPPTGTATATATPTSTATATATPTSTATDTPTPTSTATATATPTSTATDTPTPTSTATNTPVPPTSTATDTPTPTSTATDTPTSTSTATNTPVPPTSTATDTPTSTSTATDTPTSTSTATDTPTPTSTATDTPTSTSTPTSTPSNGGSSGTTLSASKTVDTTVLNGDGTATVTGTICVTNGGALATQNLTIVDQVEGKSGAGQFQSVGSPVSVNTAINPVLSPGESQCYPYSVTFPLGSNTQFRNTAEVTITNHSGHLGTSFGPTVREDINL